LEENNPVVFNTEPPSQNKLPKDTINVRNELTIRQPIFEGVNQIPVNAKSRKKPANIAQLSQKKETKKNISIANNKPTNPAYLKKITVKPIAIVSSTRVKINPTIHNIEKLSQILHGEKWFKQQPNTNLTIQVMGSAQYLRLLHSMRQLKTDDSVAIVQLKLAPKPWYSLIIGSFETKTEADKAIHELPAKLKKNKPWIRNFLSLKKQQ